MFKQTGKCLMNYQELQMFQQQCIQARLMRYSFCLLLLLSLLGDCSRHVTIMFFRSGKTNKEFNLRHDWNSLLSDDESLRMTRYSKMLFPKADVLVGKRNTQLLLTQPNAV